MRILLLLALLLPLTAQAQRPGGQAPGGTISGTIVEEATGEGIPSASVALYSIAGADTTFLTGTITDIDGAFALERVRPGSYRVRVSFVGFASQTFYPEITGQNRAADLGRIEMAEGALLLEGATVEAERAFVEQSIDRTTYNTADQVIGQTGTATDLLQQIPSVEVDQDGNVSLRGNANVAIQINGRPAPVGAEFLGVFLQQLPAGQIERIEVIPNPSARYEPDGMSGIINIVLKQDAELGLSGSVIAGVGTLGDGQASASVNYGSGPWNVTTSYAFRRDARLSEGASGRQTFVVDPRYLSPTLRDQDDDGESFGFSHLVNANADYKLSPRQTLVGALVLSARSNEDTDIQFNETTALNASSTVFERFNRIETEEGDGVSLDARLGYDWVAESGRDELRTELSYDVSDGEETERLRNELLAGTLPDLDAPGAVTESHRDHEGELRVDWIRPAGEDAKFELGYQGRLNVADDEQFLEFEDGTSRLDAFDLTDQVHAGYLIYGRTLGKWAAQAGVRGEYQDQDFTFARGGDDQGTDISRFNLFPSAFLTFAPTDAQQYRASYSRRINRPRGRQLNPFPSLDDPLNIRFGNPNLDPEFTDAFELGYSVFSNRGSFSLTPFYRRTTDVIRRTVDFDETTGVRSLTFDNLATEESYGLEAVVTARVLRTGNVLLSLNGNRQTSSGNVGGQDLGADAFVWGGRASVNLPLRPGLDLQAFGFYRAPYDTEFGRIDAFSFSNLNLRQRLMDGRLSVALSLRDAFDSSGFSFNVSEAGIYQQEASRRWDQRNLFVSLTWAFGDQQNQRRQRDRGGDERSGEGMGEMF
jgi:outer membrane receptor protein involved in Fe transport